ncbi:uncharacterized protein [Clytia hemisphaerica]|uniref:uncharacterized protein n=1 Tax=Clytia hemisphaerica TaxID=252671 RepID=UPI0034D78487
MVHRDTKQQEQLAFSQWKAKRTKTMLALLLVNLVGGIDITIILSTLVPYLKYSVRVTNVNTFYALITTAFYISSALFGVLAGKYVDRTRRMKLFTSTTLLLQIVGNLIYTVSASPAFPFVGRLLAGAGESFTGVCIGEVIRMYDSKGSNRVICWLAVMSSVGYVVGPVLSTPLANLRFHVYGVQVNGFNIAGVLIAILCLLTLVLCQIMMYDCSMEFDMKSYLAENGMGEEPEYIKDTVFSNNYYVQNLNNDDILPSEEKEPLIPPPIPDNEIDFNHHQETLNSEGKSSPIGDESLLLRGQDRHLHKEGSTHDAENLQPRRSNNRISNPFFFIKSFDQWLILAYSFIMMFIIASGESLIPLINYQVMDWSLNTLAIIFVAYGLIFLIQSLVLSKVCTTHQSMYRVGYTSLPSIITLYLALLLISLEARNKYWDPFYVTLFILSLVLVWFMESISMRSMFGRMVPSDLQSFAEALRAAVSRVGMVVASFVTPFLLSVLTYYSSCFLVLGFIMLVIYITRKKQLTDIQFVDF